LDLGRAEGAELGLEVVLEDPGWFCVGRCVCVGVRVRVWSGRAVEEKEREEKEREEKEREGKEREEKKRKEKRREEKRREERIRGETRREEKRRGDVMFDVILRIRGV
jgi:hypothetical protein